MKFDVTQILIDYLRTMRGERIGVYTAVDFIFLFAVPAMFAIATYFFQRSIDSTFFVNLFTLLGIFTAVFMAILGVLVPLFHAPAKSSGDPVVNARLEREQKTRKRLIQEVGFILSYMMLFSVSSMGILIIAIAMKSDLFLFKWISILISVHVFINLLVLLKRMHALIHYEFE